MSLSQKKKQHNNNHPCLKFAGDTNLRVIANTEEEQKSIQKEFNAFKNCSNSHWMTFNRKNMSHMYRQGLITSISAVGWESLSWN